MAFVVMIDNNEYIFIRKRSKERKKIATTTITFISLVYCNYTMYWLLIQIKDEEWLLFFNESSLSSLIQLSLDVILNFSFLQSFWFSLISWRFSSVFIFYCFFFAAVLHSYISIQWLISMLLTWVDNEFLYIYFKHHSCIYTLYVLRRHFKCVHINLIVSWEHIFQYLNRD